MSRETLTIREWTADYRTCRLLRGSESRSVEPKVMELLFLLAKRPGQVFGRAEILAAVWPNVVVSEDTLARYIFKLRRALDDDPQRPRFIETIPKRGYRLITNAAENEAGTLKRRADEFYFQAKRSDNETAIALYERALALNPDDTAALAGLANGLVQRVLRYMDAGETPRTNLEQALNSSVFSSPPAQPLLQRAQALSERALAIAPDDADALKALGLVMSARHRFEEAKALYRRALAADPKAWTVLLNLADIHGQEGHEAEALSYFERAYAVMTDIYDKDVAMVRPWYAALGTLIGDRHLALGRSKEAEAWYLRVLAYAPAHEAATVGLARVMKERGDRAAARQLCLDLLARVGHSEACAQFIAETE